MRRTPVPPSGVHVLLRGLDILECFVVPQKSIGIADICARTGLPAATVHRLLTLLIEWEAVERVSRGQYRLGIKMWRLGAAAPQARELRDIALPYLEDLYEATHAVVHLAVRDHLRTLYIEKISGRDTVPIESRVGRRLSLHATGVGKVLLAFGSRDVFEELTASPLEKLTTNTITDPDQLRLALAEIRRTGHAVSIEESSRGNGSVAAPIYDSSNTVIAAVSVVMPIEAFDPGALTPAVRAVARAISRVAGAPARPNTIVRRSAPISDS